MIEFVTMAKIPQNILYGHHYYKFWVRLSVYRIGGQIPHALVFH